MMSHLGPNAEHAKRLNPSHPPHSNVTAPKAVHAISPALVSFSSMRVAPII